MPKRWRMPPENPAIAFLRSVPEIGLLQQRLDGLAALPACEPFQHRQVIEHVVGRDPRIDAESCGR